MIVVIVGPTGVGKTKLSIELAKKLNAEIINADSMQVYKYFDIGTAKVTEEEKEGIPHHLFDICEPNDLYTVYDYQKDCRHKIEEINRKKKNIILVGGTGLYLKAALYDYKFKEETSINNYDDLTNEELFDKIKAFSIETDIHINNRKRLIRLLNKLENNSITDKNGNKPLYNFQIIGLTTTRDNLYDKINNRVDKMINNGLLAEVKNLYDKNIKSKAIQTGIGYKELYDYFDNKVSLEEAIDNIKLNSRRYAKRQYTFFNNQFPTTWFETNYDDFNSTITEVEKFLTTKKE